MYALCSRWPLYSRSFWTARLQRKLRAFICCSHPFQWIFTPQFYIFPWIMESIKSLARFDRMWSIFSITTSILQVWPLHPFGSCYARLMWFQRGIPLLAFCGGHLILMYVGLHLWWYCFLKLRSWVIATPTHLLPANIGCAVALKILVSFWALNFTNNIIKLTAVTFRR